MSQFISIYLNLYVITLVTWVTRLDSTETVQATELSETPRQILVLDGGWRESEAPVRHRHVTFAQPVRHEQHISTDSKAKTPLAKR